MCRLHSYFIETVRPRKEETFLHTRVQTMKFKGRVNVSIDGRPERLKGGTLGHLSSS